MWWITFANNPMWLGGLEAQFALYRIPTCEISLLKNPGFGELLYLGHRVSTTGSFDWRVSVKRRHEGSRVSWWRGGGRPIDHETHFLLLYSLAALGQIQCCTTGNGITKIIWSREGCSKVVKSTFDPGGRPINTDVTWLAGEGERAAWPS